MPRTYDNLILTDGVSTKSLSLSDYDPAWRVFGTDTAYQTQPVHEYRRVPYLYAAVDKRAKTVAGLPYGIYRAGDDEDLRDSPDFRGIVRGLRLRLYSTEAALCLYGAAYWLQSTNRFGRNARYDWIAPWSITPHYEPLSGLDYFERVAVYDKAPKAVQRLQPITERNGTLAYFWVPNLGSEVGPGVAPAQVAMAGAGILGNLTEYVASFFARGAVRPMIVKVPTGASEAQREQVNAWWRRFFGGVRNSHRAKALDERISVEVVGDTLDQMASDTLTTQAREDVCAALGVPHSILSADAANYATSQQDTLNFYQQTIIPSATLIAETINEQIMPDGYELRFDPAQLEVFQQHEVSKAQSLQTLVGGVPILTVDEARAMLGYEPLSAPEPEPEPLPAEADNGDDLEALRSIKVASEARRLIDAELDSARALYRRTMEQVYG